MNLPTTCLTTLFLTAAFTAHAVGQTASYRFVGTACTTGRLTSSIGPVYFAVSGVPRIGGRFTVITESDTDYPWGPRRMVWLITGISNTTTGGIKLPIDIAPLFPGQPYCGVLRTSVDVLLRAPFSPDYKQRVTMAFNVPNLRSLAGTKFYQQVMSQERSSFGPPFRSLSLSVGGEGTVGF